MIATALKLLRITLLVSTVDLIEVNTVYDSDGARQFQQLIFYDWDFQRGRYTVRGWTLYRGEPLPTPGRPVFYFRRGEMLYGIKSKAVIYSATDYDPELAERELLPQSKRRPLICLPVR